MIEISLPRLALALIPLLAVGWIAHRWSGRTAELGWATLRMLVQLLAVGYVLVLLFKIETGWMGLGVVVFMITISSWIAVRTVRKARWTAWRDALLGIGLDEDTAIIVQGDRFQVMGASYALIFDNQATTGPNGQFYFLGAGDRYNLATREATRAAQTQSSIQGVQKKPWGGR